LRKHVVGAPSYDNFEQKKNDSLFDVHLAITLEILAGILALIVSLLVGHSARTAHPIHDDPVPGKSALRSAQYGTRQRAPELSFTDPMFWMHHAEIDRIWTIWANAHAGQAPVLSGADAVLDPWPEQVSDVLTTQVGTYSYSYDQMTL
jgi:hypothetical protein